MSKKAISLLLIMTVMMTTLFSSILTVNAEDYYKDADNKEVIALAETLASGIQGTARQPEAKDKIRDAYNNFHKCIISFTSDNKCEALGKIGTRYLEGIARQPEAEPLLEKFFYDMVKLLRSSSDEQAVGLGILGECGMITIFHQPELGDNNQVLTFVKSANISRGSSEEEYELNAKMAWLRWLEEMDYTCFEESATKVTEFINKAKTRVRRNAYIDIANAYIELVANDFDDYSEYFGTAIEMMDGTSEKDIEYAAKLMIATCEPYNPFDYDYFYNYQDSEIAVLNKAVNNLQKVERNKGTYVFAISEILNNYDECEEVAYEANLDKVFNEVVESANKGTNKYVTAIKALHDIMVVEWDIDGIRVDVGSDCFLDEYLIDKYNNTSILKKNIIGEIAIGILKAVEITPEAKGKMLENFEVSEKIMKAFAGFDLQSLRLSVPYLMYAIARQPEAAGKISSMFKTVGQLITADITGAKSTALGIALQSTYMAIARQPEVEGDIRTLLLTSLPGMYISIDKDLEAEIIIPGLGEFAVQFDANGGTGNMSDQTFQRCEATAIALNTFTRKGYEFIGWNTKADGSGTTFADGAKVTNIATGDSITLYAQWKKTGETFVPNSTSIKKLTAGTKSFTVTVKKSSKANATGYQLRYSRNSGMSKATKKLISSKYNKTTKKITGLKAGKKYYVQVRVFKNVDGEKVYSKWSTKKSVKVK